MRKRFKRLVVPVRENKNVDAFITKKTLFYTQLKSKIAEVQSLCTIDLS